MLGQNRPGRRRPAWTCHVNREATNYRRVRAGDTKKTSGSQDRYSCSSTTSVGRPNDRSQWATLLRAQGRGKANLSCKRDYELGSGPGGQPSSVSCRIPASAEVSVTAGQPRGAVALTQQKSSWTETSAKTNRGVDSGENKTALS